jgi:hypothetical protein
MQKWHGMNKPKGILLATRWLDSGQIHIGNSFLGPADDEGSNPAWVLGKQENNSVILKLPNAMKMKAYVQNIFVQLY